LFCDGQYVDLGNFGDRVDQCVADLKSRLQITVTGYAYGDAQCSGNTCTAEGKAGFSCAQVGAGGAGDSSGNALGILGALAAFGLAIGRRKNERV
jgi:MYXO-CTERM domain-containing protein